MKSYSEYRQISVRGPDVDARPLATGYMSQEEGKTISWAFHGDILSQGVAPSLGAAEVAVRTIIAEFQAGTPGTTLRLTRQAHWGDSAAHEELSVIDDGRGSFRWAVYRGVETSYGQTHRGAAASWEDALTSARTTMELLKKVFPIPV